MYKLYVPFTTLNICCVLSKKALMFQLYVYFIGVDLKNVDEFINVLIFQSFFF